MNSFFIVKDAFESLLRSVAMEITVCLGFGSSGESPLVSKPHELLTHEPGSNIRAKLSEALGHVAKSRMLSLESP
jgi:hypothetical protein